MRRLPAYAAAASVLLTLSGCISVEVGKDTAQQAQFRISDTGAAPAPAARNNGRDLIIAPQPAASVDDSFALTYSRVAGQRAAYQFATWSERPSTRLSQLLVERLAARRAFNSVALAGRGVGGTLQLNLSVNDFYHDASSSAVARVDVSAELIDRATRQLIARQNFSASAPVAQANSAGAAAALSDASGRVLAELAAWVETKAAPAAMASR
jgi:cholesterol transport system auxiliary component